jgi:hypothetical protein
VALDGSTALIGAPTDSQRGRASGASYLFALSGEGPRQIAKLTASDAEANSQFGHAVALSGDLAIVGSPGEFGAAYLFRKDGEGRWHEIAKLAAEDAKLYDGFGCAVAISGQTAVVGSLHVRNPAHEYRAAYVFQPNPAGHWRQVAKLAPADPAGSPMIVRSLALSGETLIVGACRASGAQRYAGAAYVFQCDGPGSWRQVAKLTSPDAEAMDQFGWSVSLSGDVAIIGAPWRDNRAGAAYVFRTDDAGNWRKLVAYTAAQAEALFGAAVALSGETALVGAPQHDDAAVNAGSAYAFRIGGLP